MDTCLNVARARTTLTPMCHHLEVRVLKWNVLVHSKNRFQLCGGGEGVQSKNVPVIRKERLLQAIRMLLNHPRSCPIGLWIFARSSPGSSVKLPAYHYRLVFNQTAPG